MSRWINHSDDTVWDFLHDRQVKPGDVLTVPDEDDDGYENHPYFSRSGDLGYLHPPNGDNTDKVS